MFNVIYNILCNFDTYLDNREYVLKNKICDTRYMNCLFSKLHNLNGNLQNIKDAVCSKIKYCANKPASYNSTLVSILHILSEKVSSEILFLETSHRDYRFNNNNINANINVSLLTSEMPPN